MKRNELKEIVDRELASLTWDEAKSARVLDALDAPSASPALPVRRKLSLAVVLAALLTLLATTALAVALIRYSPRVSHENHARRLLMSQYGLTQETLGLFRSEVTEEDGETVVSFTPLMWEDDFTGVYTVRLRGSEGTATWSYDNLDPALWQDGDFAASVWGPPQLTAYLAEGAHHSASSSYTVAHIRDYSHVDARPTPGSIDMNAYWNGEMWLYEAVRADEDMSFEEAREITRTALIGMFDLSEKQAADINFFEGHLIEWDDGRHIWDVWGYLYMDGMDLGFYSVIDAKTGEVMQIGLETGGNG